MILKSLHDFLPEHPAISYVPFHPAHVISMKIDDKHTEAVSKGVDIKTMLEMQSKMGTAITAYLHGRPVACFGYVKLWDGVAEMWLLIEERGREFGKTLTRGAIAFRDYAVITENLHRLQITVRCDDIRAVKWAKVIGFLPECVMHQYGPDKASFYLFART